MLLCGNSLYVSHTKLVGPRGSEGGWKAAVAKHHLGRHDLIHGQFGLAQREFWQSIRIDSLAMPKAVPALLLALIGSRRLVAKAYGRTSSLSGGTGDVRPDETAFGVRLV